MTCSTLYSYGVFFRFIFAFTLVISKCYADTSEVSIAIETGSAWRSQQATLKSDYEDWVIHDSDQRQMSPMVSGRVGLGLSFTTEVWVRGTLEYLNDIKFMRHTQASCSDSSRTEALSQGEQLILSDIGQCTRSKTFLSSSRGRLELGGTYRPFDDWSPLIELSLGVSYLPTSEGLEIIEGVSQMLVWEDFAQGRPLKFTSVWGWQTRLGLGAEVRAWSQWGVRVTGWGALESGHYASHTALGLNLAIIYYRYIRLL